MILFDSHVHIYDCFDLDSLFEAVFENFHRVGKSLGSIAGNVCFLLLTESTGSNYYLKLQEIAHRQQKSTTRPWSVTKNNEECSLLISHAAYRDISVVVVAGRQLITAERLELLALLTDASFEDGMELAEAVAAVAAQGGIPVCPWGAGKWLGGRGKILLDFLRNNQSQDVSFFLGDSGGRPWIWPKSTLLGQANSGNLTLSGSDPLPLVGEEQRVGSFGGYLDDECSIEKPAGALRKLFLNPGTIINNFGGAQNPATFLKNQIALRLQ